MILNKIEVVYEDFSSGEYSVITNLQRLVIELTEVQKRGYKLRSHNVPRNPDEWLRFQFTRDSSEQQLDETLDEPGLGFNPQILFAPVEELDIPVRAYNCFRNSNIRSVYDLVTKDALELGRLKNMGKRTVGEIETALEQLGLRLGMKFSHGALERLKAIT